MFRLLWRNLAYRLLEWTAEPVTVSNIWDRIRRVYGLRDY